MQLAFSKPTGTKSEEELLFNDFRPIGFDGLQLKYGQYSNYLSDPEHFKEIWGHLPGVASALIVGGPLNEEGQKSLRNLFQFAGKIGSERIVFCHALSRKAVTQDDIKSFAKVLSELALEARQNGTQLSLHHHYDQPVMYHEDIRVFFGEAKPETVTLTVDTAHLVKSGIHDVASVIQEFSPVIDNFHLKDFEAGNWQVLGRGSIKFGPIFDAIKEIQYDGWLSADEESGSEVSDAMHTCYSYMSTHLNT